MIHPSYVELMQVVNNDSTVIGEEPVVNSRYSIVIAAAKRARQIIGGDEPTVGGAAGKKPLSVAVQELYEGKVKIISEENDSDHAGLLQEKAAGAMGALEENGALTQADAVMEDATEDDASAGAMEKRSEI